MGKIIEKVKLTSLFDPKKSKEVEAVIDTGATMLVLPQNIVDELNLKEIRKATVKYANNQIQEKSVYAGLVIEVKGRVGNFEAVAEVTGSEPLIGQIVLEALDLVVEPRTRTLIPNPRSPEMPMVEILMATAWNNGNMTSPFTTSRSPSATSASPRTPDRGYLEGDVVRQKIESWALMVG